MAEIRVDVRNNFSRDGRSKSRPDSSSRLHLPFLTSKRSLWAEERARPSSRHRPRVRRVRACAPSLRGPAARGREAEFVVAAPQRVAAAARTSSFTPHRPSEPSEADGNAPRVRDFRPKLIRGWRRVAACHYDHFFGCCVPLSRLSSPSLGCDRKGRVGNTSLPHSLVESCVVCNPIVSQKGRTKSMLQVLCTRDASVFCF